MKKRTKSILTIAAALAAIYAFNKYIQTSSTKKNILTDTQGSYYNWKLGKIYYTKHGKGSPVLLIHDANPISSSEEWNKISKKLAKTHTVYAIDLLGCGRSDKPQISYINYMYVQLINSFVKDIIREKTTIAATGSSTPFVIMANHMEPDLFNQIFLINPVSIESTQRTPDIKSKLVQKMINLPLIGTFAYNLMLNPVTMNYFNKKKYSPETAAKEAKLMDTYHESAHLGNSNGKYLYSSILGNYINIDIYKALKEIKKPVTIISSKQNEQNRIIAGKYRMINSRVNIYNLSTDSPYPHLDAPKKVLKLLAELNKGEM